MSLEGRGGGGGGGTCGSRIKINQLSLYLSVSVSVSVSLVCLRVTVSVQEFGAAGTRSTGSRKPPSPRAKGVVYPTNQRLGGRARSDGLFSPRTYQSSLAQMSLYEPETSEESFQPCSDESLLV